MLAVTGAKRSHPDAARAIAAGEFPNPRADASVQGRRWDWERDELVSKLVGALAQCGPDIQQRMRWHFSESDADYDRRVAEGLGVSVPATCPAGLAPVHGEAAGVGGAGAIG